MSIEQSSPSSPIPLHQEVKGQESDWRLKAFYGLKAVAIGILLFSILVTLIRSLDWPLIHDAPLLHFIASEILAGAAPYKDIVDMNMPGTYLLHMLALIALGSGDVAWRMFDLIWLGFATGGIVLFTRSFGPWISIFSSAFYFAFHLSQGPTRLGQRDFLMIPFLMFGAHFLANSLEERSSKWNMFGVGLFMGCAIIIKPFSLILLAFFGVIVIRYSLSHSEEILSKLTNLFLSSALIPLLVLAWLYSIESLNPLWIFATEYLIPLYSQLNATNYWSMFVTILKSSLLLTPIIIPFFLCLRHGSIHLSPRLTILILCTVYGALHFILQGKGWAYHLEPYCFFVFTLWISLLGMTLEKTTSGLRIAAMAGCCIMALLMGGQSLAAGLITTPFITKKEALVHQLEHDLATLPLQKTDTIQILDTAEGGIHALLRLGRHLPTRFMYDFHFYHDIESPFIQDLRREFIQGLQDNPPHSIVLFHFHWLPPFDESRINSFPELTDLLDTHYPRRQQRDDYTIYSSK